MIAAGVAAFLVISAGLARVLGAAGAERGATVEIVKAQARGDREAVIARIEGCRANARCRARIGAVVARLHGDAPVRVLRLDGPPGLALRARAATARIAWRAGDALPVVQCVRLRRSGDVLRGFEVRVLALGDPIEREGSC